MNRRIAIIRSGKIVYMDEHSSVIKPTETEARSKREQMKAEHRKDMLQRNQVDYYKAFPEQAKNLSDGARRLLS